jgi:hypothetical protein
MPKVFNPNLQLLEDKKVELPPELVYYTFEEAAVILNTTIQTIKRWRDQGDLKTTVLGTLMGGREVISLAQLIEHNKRGVNKATKKRRLKRRLKKRRIKEKNEERNEGLED